MIANNVLIFSPRYPFITLIDTAQNHAEYMEHQHDGRIYAHADDFGGDEEIF